MVLPVEAPEVAPAVKEKRGVHRPPVFCPGAVRAAQNERQPRLPYERNERPLLREQPVVRQGARERVFQAALAPHHDVGLLALPGGRAERFFRERLRLEDRGVVVRRLPRIVILLHKDGVQVFYRLPRPRVLYGAVDERAQEKRAFGDRRAQIEIPGGSAPSVRARPRRRHDSLSDDGREERRQERDAVCARDVGDLDEDAPAEHRARHGSPRIAQKAVRLHPLVQRVHGGEPQDSERDFARRARRPLRAERCPRVPRGERNVQEESRAAADEARPGRGRAQREDREVLEIREPEARHEMDGRRVQSRQQEGLPVRSVGFVGQIEGDEGEQRDEGGAEAVNFIRNRERKHGG